MNRLIKKDKYGEFEPINHNAVCEKLHRLENIEEQLGCPLDVVFKALKNGIYFNFNRTSKEEFIEPNDLSLKISLGGFYCLYFEQWNDGYEVDLAYYKKTWWLKEDRSK